MLKENRGRSSNAHVRVTELVTPGNKKKVGVLNGCLINGYS